MKHFGVISKPLTGLLKKNTLFVWTSDHQLAFDTPKQALIQALVLVLPNLAKKLCTETDASDLGVGAVLMQDGHPIAYISKALGPRTKGLSTYEEEYLSILLVVEQWQPYLQHSEFVVYTDQKSLSHLNEQRLHTHWQQKVFTKLLGLRHQIIYKKGSDNRVADALSRKVSHNSVCAAVSATSPLWLEAITDSYLAHDNAKLLITKFLCFLLH